MKRAFALFFLALLLLTGCAKKAEIVVNPDNHTISDGSYTYEYTDTIVGYKRTIEIIYPDGGTYTWETTDFGSVAVPRTGPNMYFYTSGSDLVNAIVNPGAQPEQRTFTWVNVLVIVLGALLVVWGLCLICRPDKVWNIFYKWFYEEDASYYAMSRIVGSGIGLLVVGVMIILFGIFAI